MILAPLIILLSLKNKYLNTFVELRIIAIVNIKQKTQNETHDEIIFH